MPDPTLRAGLVREAGVLIGTLAAALLLRWAAQPWMGHTYPFVTIFPAVAALSWYRGARLGIPAAILGGLAATFLFIEPPAHLRAPSPGDWLGIALFLLASGFIVALGEQRRRSSRSEESDNISAYRLAAIVESSDDVIVSKTLQGIITSWNAAAERLFGYTAEEAVGRHITLIIPPERHSEENMIVGRLTRGERVEHFETVRRAKDGRLIDVALTTSPIRDSTGRVIGASKIARDITAQRHAAAEREQLLAAERTARSEAERLSRLKDEFVATLSHELRTPLNAILGWTQMLRQNPASGDLEKGLEVIERNARAQSRMIEDLLDVSRITSGKLRLDVQRVKVAEIVESVVASVAPAADAKNIRLQTTLDPRTNLVNGDPTRLQQIVWNLLTNAIKFTPKGGRIQLVLRRVNSRVEIIVSDTGQGISPEFLPSLFQPFRQADASTSRRAAGLGLGLSIVKHLVELHGGTVSAASTGEGKGSTFTVSLPLAILHTRLADTPEEHPLVTATMPSARSPGPSLARIKVLVVEDDNDARDLIIRILSGAAAEVVAAPDAAEAMQRFAQFRPDVVVSDIGLPGQDGYELIRAIRALPSDQGRWTPAAALTALARSEDRTRAMLAGYQVHVSKPIEASELIAVVGSLARLSVRDPGWRQPTSTN